MKKYRVVVDGTEYEIGIEALDDAALIPKAKSPVEPAKSAVLTQNAKPASQQTAGEAIKSPMPGNILSVLVKEGSQVKKGQVLMILEAMKMENEIIAPRDAIVTSVKVQNGMSVETGTVLCSLQ